MNFSAWAIRRPLPALMIFFVLCVAGLWGFHKLPVARFPDVSLPDGDGRRRAARRLAGAAGDRSHAQGRGRGRDHHRRQARHLERVRGPVAAPRSSSCSTPTWRPRSTTCATRSRASAPTCRRTSRNRWSAKVDIGGSLMTYTVGSRAAQHRRAELAGRPRDQQGAVRRARRGAGRARRAASTARSASTSTRRRCRPGA